MFSDTFMALNKEAQFTREILGAGATEIRNANYASKGVYFQAFTSLTTGLERMGKLCVMMDHFLENNGSFPSPDAIRKMSHKLTAIYTSATDIVRRRGIQMSFLPNLDNHLHHAILQCLSDFALGDRYANINLLVGDGRKSDPIAQWSRQVDGVIFSNLVSEKKKKRIEEGAQIVDAMMGAHSMVIHTSDLGTAFPDLKSASFQTGIDEAVAPYRQLLIMQIIRYWVEILRHLQYEAMGQGSNDIPYFSEIFAPFMNEDSYIRTRKSWTRI